MNLWIRSQDKEKIVKINYLDIVTNVPNTVSKIVYEKSVHFNIDDVECLGTYSSRERCIEILDDIQNKIFNVCHNNNSEYIYEMPNE